MKVNDLNRCIIAINIHSIEYFVSLDFYVINEPIICSLLLSAVRHLCGSLMSFLRVVDACKALACTKCNATIAIEWCTARRKRITFHPYTQNMNLFKVPHKNQMEEKFSAKVQHNDSEKIIFLTHFSSFDSYQYVHLLIRMKIRVCYGTVCLNSLR